MSSRALPARLHVAGTADEAPALMWRHVGEAEPATQAGAWLPHSAPAATAGQGTAGAAKAGPAKPASASGAANSPEADTEELERILAEAQVRAQAAAAQSFKDGFSQGRLEGEQLVRAEVATLMERLARTIADLSGTRDAFRHEAEADVVRLSLGVARRVLHREVSIDPDALLGLIRVALGKFAARELHRILVSPQDQPALTAALVSLKLPRQVEVIGDPSLERGAALFETVKGTLDASVDTQLDEIERGFLDVLGKEGRHG